MSPLVGHSPSLKQFIIFDNYLNLNLEKPICIYFCHSYCQHRGTGSGNQPPRQLEISHWRQSDLVNFSS